MNITYVKGDATRPNGEGVKIIAHVCNNRGGWGKGFVLSLSKRWSKPESVYRTTKQKLGFVQFVVVEIDTIVANMIAQNGYGGLAIQYGDLRNCLKDVATKAKKFSASVHMPKIGTGLGGGKWEEIEPIIIEELCDKSIEVTVYELK